MNYYIEKHDMEIILDALELLKADIESTNNNPYETDESWKVKRLYTNEDVYKLYKTLGEQLWDLK